MHGKWALIAGCAAVLLAAAALAQEADGGEAVEQRFQTSRITGTRVIIGEPAAAAHFVRDFDLRDLRQNTVAATQTLTSSQTKASADTTGSSATALVLQHFSGPVNGYPPDPAIAAGPGHIMAAVNGSIVIYDKTGKQLRTTSTSAFMFAPATAMFDTHLVYDKNTQRFFVLCVGGDQRSTGAIYLAVSSTSDPTGGWHLFTLDQSTTYWADFPSFTVTASGLVVAFQEVNARTCPVLSVKLSDLLAGAAAPAVTRFDSPFSGPGFCNIPIMAVNEDGGDTAYGISINGGDAGNSLAIATISTAGTPTLRTSVVPVSTWTYKSPVQQPGGTPMYLGSPQINYAVVKGGTIYATQTVTQSAGNAAVRWYQIEPETPKMLQVGEVSGVGNAMYGGIVVLPNDDVDIVYTTFNSTVFPSAGYAHRSAADPLNTMPVTGVYQEGSASYTPTRWGDFFQMAPDPDGNSAWGIAEYATGSSSYGTAIVQLAASSGASVATAPLSVSVDPASATIALGQSAKFTVKVAGQTAGTVNLSCTGLPTGATCTFNPASLSGTGTATLTITMPTTIAAATPGTMRWLAMLAVGIFGLIILPRQRRNVRYGGTLLVVIVVAGMLACGGTASSPSSPSTATPTPTPATPTPPTTTPTNPAPTPPPPTGTTGTPSVRQVAVTVNATSGTNTASSTVNITVP